MVNKIDFKVIQGHSSPGYSQRGQDGILKYLFSVIGVTNKHCVEFGFNSETVTGGTGANCARLIVEDGWTGLFFDSDFQNPSIRLYKENLTFENISQVFKSHYLMPEPDYVSIDVDSCDLWLMKGMLLGGFRPRVISVEYNVNFPLDMSVTCRKTTKWKNDMIYGASLKALNTLAEEMDYVLVAVEFGADLFFVRKDILPEQISAFEYCGELTKHRAHPPTSIDRITKELIEYPNEGFILPSQILGNPDIFRLKQ